MKPVIGRIPVVEKGHSYEVERGEKTKTSYWRCTACDEIYISLDDIAENAEWCEF